MKGFLLLLIVTALGIATFRYYPELSKLFKKQEAIVKSPSPTITSRKVAPHPDYTAPPQIPTSPKASTSAYQTVEEFTENWTKISPTAFPRAVKLNAEVEFKGTFGSSKFQPGSTVQAMGFTNGTLTLAPSVDSDLRGSAELDQTNLKDHLTSAYNEWLERRKKRATAAATYRKTLTEQPGQAITNAPARIGPEPMANPDGSYAVVLASLGSKVREITPSNIKHWSKAQLVNHDGTPYWSVQVSYTAQTIFGDIDTEGQALIQNNTVQKWIYTGSKEEIQ